MSKNSFQDMIKIKIIKEDEPLREREIFNKNRRDEDDSSSDSNRSGGHYPAIWIVALASLVFLFFAISFLFTKAKVTINPKIQEIILNENLVAFKDSNDSNQLSFSLVSLEGEESKEVQGLEQKELSEKAKGSVVIYNAYSPVSQKLLIDTRLEGTNGKIYKTEKAVIVPGMQGDTPGSVEVGIYANEAGEEYNSDPLDFKIFGFKDSPKYDKFYARSTGNISGGLVGTSYAINGSDLNKEDLQNILQEKLFNKIVDEIPDGFILYKNAVFFQMGEETTKEISENSGTMLYTMKGTLYGFLFNETKLTKEIAKVSIDNYDNSEVYISNVKDLVFSLNGNNIDFSQIDKILFNLSGTTKIIYQFNSEDLITKLLGKDKKDFNSILSEYLNIESASSVIKPAWKSSFPNKEKDIKIIVNYPEK